MGRDYRVNFERDPDGFIVRQGPLRLRIGEIRDQGGGGFADPPPPECCCADDPEEIMDGMLDDLILFYDSWYGNAYRVTVDTNWYEWQSSPCGEPGIRLPTEAYLDTLKSSENRCGEFPPFFTMFNHLRDAIQFMSSLIVRKPSGILPITDNCTGIDCSSPDPFDIRFTPTYPCEHFYSQDCDFTGFPDSQRRVDTRVAACHRICQYHYQEMVDLVDDMMTNGVVVLEAEVRSVTPCSVETGKVCVRTTTTPYTATNASGCYHLWNANFPLCFEDDYAISDLVIKDCSADFLEDAPRNCTRFRSCGDISTPYYDDVSQSTYDNWVEDRNIALITQNGPSELIIDNTGACDIFRIVVPVTIVWEQRRNSGIGFSDCEREVVIDINESDWYVCIERGLDGYGFNLKIIDGKFSSCNAPGGGSYIPEYSTNGIITVAGSASMVGAFSFEERECFLQSSIRTRLKETVVTFTASGTNCGSSLGCGSCEGCEVQCPGSQQLATISDAISVVELAQPEKCYEFLSNCGDGTVTQKDLRFEIRVAPSCPAAGVTNVVPLDRRISGTVDGTWRAKTVSPTLITPTYDCPGSDCQVCQPLCLRVYAEIA